MLVHFIINFTNIYIIYKYEPYNFNLPFKKLVIKLFYYNIPIFYINMYFYTFLKNYIPYGSSGTCRIDMIDKDLKIIDYLTYILNVRDVLWIWHVRERNERK